MELLTVESRTIFLDNIKYGPENEPSLTGGSVLRKGKMKIFQCPKSLSQMKALILADAALNQGFDFFNFSYLLLEFETKIYTACGLKYFYFEFQRENKSYNLLEVYTILFFQWSSL